MSSATATPLDPVAQFLAAKPAAGHHPAACWTDISGHCTVTPFADNAKSWANVRKIPNLTYNGYSLSNAEDDNHWIKWAKDYTADAIVAAMIEKVIASKTADKPFLNYAEIEHYEIVHPGEILEPAADEHYDPFFRQGGFLKKGGESEIVRVCRGYNHKLDGDVMTYEMASGFTGRLYVSDVDQHIAPTAEQMAVAQAASDATNARYMAEQAVAGVPAGLDF